MAPPPLSSTDALRDLPRPATDKRMRLLAVFPGEGIGPEVVASALEVLDALESRKPLDIERVTGGPIGITANKTRDGELTQAIAGFCEEIFAAGGVLFCGPAGGRFVYDLRRHFDLFCKLVPVRPSPVLAQCSRFKPETLRDIDLLVVRDNAGGLYQGVFHMRQDPDQGRIADHHFQYTEQQVRRIIEAGARTATLRRQKMHVVVKDGGVPGISSLWREIALEAAKTFSVQCEFLNVDHAAYRLIQFPQEFDVIVTPNMIGDILADLAAVFLASRGLSFSGNFAGDGRAAYQTGHGAAYDLAGTNRANPVAQIHSLAMLLRESFGCREEAALIEQAVEEVWKQGWRTEDLAQAGCRTVGTREMGALIAAQVASTGLGRGDTP